MNDPTARRTHPTFGFEQMTRREIIILLCIIAGALALRIGYQYEMRGNILMERLQLDEAYHDRWARSIAAGDLIGEGVFFRAPLYPYLIGMLYAITGPVPDAVRIAQHLLGSVLVALVYLLSRVLFGRGTAVAASLMAACYAVLICFEGRLLFDFLVTLLAFGWVTLAVLWVEAPSSPRYALLGLVFGLLCTMRPPFLALAVPLFGYIFWRHLRNTPRVVPYSLSLLCAFLLPILVVTVRNVVVGGDFVVLASQGGINFYIGNNPESDGITPSVPEAGGVAWENRQVEHIAQQALGRPPRPSEVSSFWFAKGWDFIRTEPLAAAKLLLRKFYLFWSHIEIPNNLSYYSFERASGLLSSLPVGFWLVGPLGIAGALLAWKEPRTNLLLIFLVSYCCIAAAFFVCDRFRLPVVPVLCVFSGYVIDHLIRTVKARRWNVLGLTGAFLGAGALVVNTNACHLQPDDSLGEIEVHAHAALDSGDLPGAAELFAHITALDPENSGAHVNRGIALWGMGRIDEAIQAFHSGLGRDPHLALMNLAQLYFNLQRLDSSLFYAERSIAARPFAPGGYIIGAKSMIALQNTRGAEELLLRGVAACREDFVYGEYLLAGLALERGELSTADSMYRNVLVRTGQSRGEEYVLQSEKTQYGESFPTLHAKALHARGRVFAARNHLDSSVVYLQAAAHLLPMRVDVWADLGVCLLRLNRLEEADTAMQRAMQINANNPVLWLNYGTLLARKGELERAKGAVARALALKPDFKEARQLMAILSRSQHR